MALFHFILVFFPLGVCTFFIPSSVIGHLGAFPILAVLRRAAMEVVVHVCFQVSICVCVCVCVCVCFSKMSPGVEMLDHVGVAILFF